MSEEIDVVGGLGHVGLPLSLKFALEGHDVNIIEKDKSAIRLFKEGKARFQEEGVEDAIEECRDDIDFAEEARETATVFLTTDNENCFGVLKSSLPEDFEGIVCMRQTVPPGTSDDLKEKIQDYWSEVQYAFTPERLAQGKGLEEIDEIPQVIGTEDEETYSFLKDSIFTWVDCFHTSEMEAELVKLYCNFYRYGTFALSNEMKLISEELGADFGKVYEAATLDYPRMSGAPAPGVSSGFCLPKDVSYLSEYSSLASSVYETNMEKFFDWMFEEMKKEIDQGNQVGLFGLTAKPNNDETRCSLMSNLAIRMSKITNPAKLSERLLDILFGVEDFKFYDPYIESYSLEETKKSEVWVMGIPHDEFDELDLPEDKDTIDPWEFFELGKLV